MLNFSNFGSHCSTCQQQDEQWLLLLVGGQFQLQNFLYNYS